MLKNYLKISIRNLLTQKSVTLINILCLAVAVGCSVVAYLFVDNHVNREWIHENAENIFLIEQRVQEEGDLLTYGTTPTPLGPAIAQDFSEVARTVRIAASPIIIKHRDRQFTERVRLVDTGFLDMFTIPLASGDSRALREKNAIFLSQEMAKKYFGDEDPLGKPLTLQFPGRNDQTFLVRGVTAPIPSQSCVEFSLFLSYENRFEAASNEFFAWDGTTQATFVQLYNPSDAQTVASRLNAYVKLQNASGQSDKQVQALILENLLVLKKNVAGVKSSIVGRPLSWTAVILFTSLAGLMLSLSCVNFINISLAMVNRRLKEIGIRKTIGAGKRQLIFQFLSENVFVSVISFVVAVALTGSFLLPAFNGIFEQGLIMDFSLRINLWVYLFALLVLVGILSGLYPALYISSFKPVYILRERMKLGSQNKLMQGLLSFQFVLSLVTMVVSVGLTLNLNDMRKRDWGYAKDDIVVVRTNNEAQHVSLQQLTSQLPDVLSTAGSGQHLGLYQTETRVGIGEDESHAVIFDMGDNYFETMGFVLSSGKLPDAANLIVVNEEFARRFKSGDYSKETVTIDKVEYAVCGIVRNFHHEHFQNDIEPLVFRNGNPSQFRYLVIRTAPGATEKTVTALAGAWKKNFPDNAFDFVYQRDTFDSMFEHSKGLLRILIFTAVIALVMSCVGFYGLVTQRTQQKMKEVCIRKIFGISGLQSVMLVNAPYGVLLIIAAVIATPLSYAGLNFMLDEYYTYHMLVGPLPFALAYALVITTLIVVLSRKVYEITVTNPAEVLRSE